MRLALWTPRPDRWSWLLGRADPSVVLVREDPPTAPEADLDIYHLDDEAEYAFVVCALRRRPGLLVLERLGLHAAVHAATAGRGDAAGYLRAARRSAGAPGVFVARQFLAGRGGGLAPLLPFDSFVLETALAVLVTDRRLLVPARRALGRRPLRLELAGDASSRLGRLESLAQAALAERGDRSRWLYERQAEDSTPQGRALGELRPAARELGLPELPPEVGRAVRELFARDRAAGA